METVLAGLGFEVGPDPAVTTEERLVLDRLGGRSFRPSLRIALVEGPGTAHAEPRVAARVCSADGQRVQVSHAAFEAELDPLAGEGWLRRVPGPAFPLEITLRVALAACLPAAGGLPVHAAGVVIDGNGAVFYGPSGAGKSTLAGGAPWPVLSDELVAIVGGERFGLAASGFWGSAGDGALLRARFPLAALVELGKGPAFRWERLAPSLAIRRLAQVTLVPPAAALWSRALAVIGRLAYEVPVYRMEWSPASAPWDDIATALKGRV